MSAADEPGGDKSVRLALAAVAIVVLLVLGTLAVDALRRPGGAGVGSSDRDGTGGSPSENEAAPPDGVAEEPDAPETTSSAGSPGDIASWRKLLKTDPAAAAAALGQMDADADRDARMEELMEHWVATAPGDAGNWLLAQPRGEFRDESAAEFSRAWAARDPVAAARWVKSHIETPAGEQAIGGLISNWARQDPEAAKAWVESLEHHPAALAASSAFAYTWVQSSPSAASRWVAAITDPGLRAAAAKNLVNAWSDSDPAAAAAWLAVNLTDPQQRDAAALPLLMTWADTDPRAASQWVAGLPGGELQEVAKVIFAESLVDEAPEDAVVWARSIGDAEQRNESILNIYEDWIETDKPALLSHLRRNLAANAEPELREEIYDLLFEHDPEFRAELLRLYEESGQ